LIKSKICDLLSIEYPIIQGGMAWVATAELAAAVSEAGGLGLIGAGHMPPDALRDEIRKVKSMTKKPFGVNIMLMSPFVKEVMQVVVDERIPVVTTGAGSPSEYIPALKEIGCKVIPVVASVALAKRLERTGIDALIAEGTESGGHIGQVTTMALVPQIVDAVSVPVIAAGGIADSRGFVAALSLGAEAVQIGTRFVVAEECIAHENYKQAIIKAKDRSTVISGASTGHPVRVIENQLSRQFEQMEAERVNPEELEKLGAGRLRMAVREGDVTTGTVMAGQISGMITKIQSTKEIIEEIIGGVPGVLERLEERK
jgi:putative enoyl-(acyl-carrier-protein) reductase II